MEIGAQNTDSCAVEVVWSWQSLQHVETFVEWLLSHNPFTMRMVGDVANRVAITYKIQPLTHGSLCGGFLGLSILGVHPGLEASPVS